MEIVLGIGFLVLFVFLAFKLIRLIFRAITAPFRNDPRAPRPNFQVEVVYSGSPMRRNPTAGKLVKKPVNHWVPEGGIAKVGRREIPGGLIYVGTDLSGANSEYEVDAALINPRLEVKDAAKCGSSDMNYWPSYAGISPACRGRYLNWLAGGRSDPDEDIGFVFLFFYGLERRLFIDPQLVAVSLDEKRAIRNEVARLLSIYGDNGSFGKYAETFMDISAVILREGPLYGSSPPTAGHSWELPMSVRVAIAELARDGLPVPADWAFAWAWFDPENSVRTPAQRCRPEMQKLFEMRYFQKYGEGMRIKPNKRTVRLEYRAASPSIYEIPVQGHNDLPDVTSLKGPIKKLRDLFDGCNADLDAYSRWLGRNPGQKGSLQGIALLPSELVSPASMGDSISGLSEALAEAVHVGGCSAVSSERILLHWPPANTGKYRKADAVALAQFLEKLGYGIEPDVRFGGPRLDTVDNAVVFRLGQDAPTVPTRDYLAAELSLRLAAAVAVADGVVSEDERRSLEQLLSSSSSLSSGDRDRLCAHLEWLLVERPGLTGLKGKFAELQPSTRVLLGQTLLVTAAADGTIDPEEIKTIRKLYAQLGLDPESVYSDLHSLAIGSAGPATGPVTVRGEERSRGFSIPPQGETSGASRPAARVVLDPVLIAAKRLEAQQAAALLGSIFTADDDDEPSENQPGPATATVIGLDSPHSALLMRLLEKDQWAMDDIAAMADQLDLLAEGALETINEAAWDSAGGPLLDITDIVTIDRSVLKELLA